MSLVRVIAEVEYIPLRAVPLVTGEALSVDTLADMIADPERFCDHQFGEVITPQRLTPKGSLERADYRIFSALPRLTAAKSMADRLGITRLPPGLFVPLEPVREKYDLVMHFLVPKRMVKLSPNHVSFSTAPALSAADLKIVCEGIAAPRANDVTELRNQILSCFKQLISLCRTQGIELDLSCLPGTSKTWLRHVEPLLPKLATRAPSTFKAHCHASNIHWVQGQNPVLWAKVEKALRGQHVAVSMG